MNDNTIYTINTDDGLRTLTEYMPNRNITSINIYLHAGSLYEDNPKNVGVAHFIEHMAFTSDDRRTSKEIWEMAEEYGISLNASTSREFVVYSIVGPNENVLKAIDLLTSLIDIKDYRDEEIENQRKIIQREADRKRTRWSSYIYDLMNRGVYSGDLKYSVLGYDNIKNITKENLIKFKNDFYTIDNMFISIAGGGVNDNNINQVIDKFNDNFKDLNKFSVKKSLKEIEKPQFIPNKVVYNYADTEHAYLMLTNEYMNETNNNFDIREFYKLTLMAKALGGGMSSLLEQRIREELGLTYNIGSYKIMYKYISDLAISTNVNDKDIVKTTKEILDVCNKFYKNKIDDKTFNRVKNSVISRRIMEMDDPKSVSGDNFRFRFWFNNFISNDQTLDIIQNLTPDDINQVIDDYFDPNKFSLTYISKNEYPELEEIIKG